MKIIRYSVDGFKPQVQTFHLSHIDYQLNEFDINVFPEHLKPLILESHNEKVHFYKKHLEDFKEGIWVFIEGHKNGQALNHLKTLVPCWEADIEDSAEVYDCNWTKVTIISDKMCEIFGCYIPKRELSKISNIKRKVKNKTLKTP